LTENNPRKSHWISGSYRSQKSKIRKIKNPIFGFCVFLVLSGTRTTPKNQKSDFWFSIFGSYLGRPQSAQAEEWGVEDLLLPILLPVLTEADPDKTRKSKTKNPIFDFWGSFSCRIGQEKHKNQKSDF